eukprot:Hpha_TRINITY_DN8881_c0_g1::TRINITY_DN8881_c0_g1_i1::g.141538::m.141538/K20844/abf1; non-reducing end alpha-L-arabinofuranosidase
MKKAAAALCLALGARAGEGPCDIFGSGGHPCIAAHSTVRALYGGYGEQLYQVKRVSDGTTADIFPLVPGGQANASAQDAFCAGSSCVIQRIYDQSPKGNHLQPGEPGGAGKQKDSPVNATAMKLLLGGRDVWGAYFDAGQGYRNDQTSGVATGDQPETIYMVASGRHYNDKCCFDYGNAETNNLDDGKGAMECVYLGNAGGHTGDGPFVMADLEQGLWPGNVTSTPTNTPIIADFVTAMVKGGPGYFALKGGDAQKGKLRTLFDGPRPPKYEVMKKQGAIILGIGGDNSDWAIGTFFEGAMTAGYSSDVTDDALQANIVAAHYGQ